MMPALEIGGGGCLQLGEQAACGHLALCVACTLEPSLAVHSLATPHHTCPHHLQRLVSSGPSDGSDEVGTGFPWGPADQKWHRLCLLQLIAGLREVAFCAVGHELGGPGARRASTCLACTASLGEPRGPRLVAAIVPSPPPRPTSTPLWAPARDPALHQLYMHQDVACASSWTLPAPGPCHHHRHTHYTHARPRHPHRNHRHLLGPPSRALMLHAFT